MTATTTKPKETWRDWVAPGAIPQRSNLLTRQALIDRLAEDGIEVGESDFLYWQREDILPYSVKLRSNNVTRAYYPFWMADVVKELIRLRTEERGLLLSAIRPRLRALAHKKTYPWVTGTLRDRSEPFIPIAENIARLYAEISGTKITAVRLQLFDEQKEMTQFTFDTDGP